MSLLGGGAVSEMQKSYKQNRALGKKKKSLKERGKAWEGTKPGKKLEYNKMTPEEYKLFQEELIAKKKKDQQRVLVFYSVIGLVTLSLIVFLKYYIGF